MRAIVVPSQDDAMIPTREDVISPGHDNAISPSDIAREYTDKSALLGKEEKTYLLQPHPQQHRELQAPRGREPHVPAAPAPGELRVGERDDGWGERPAEGGVSGGVGLMGG